MTHNRCCNILDIDIPIEETAIDFDIGYFTGVKDVKINGQSIVNDDVAEITLGTGLTFNNGEITLSVANAPFVRPKEMSLGEQEETKIIIIDNGVVKQTTLNDLDYSKLSRTNNLNEVRIGDYLFKTN